MGQSSLSLGGVFVFVSMVTGFFIGYWWYKTTMRIQGPEVKEVDEELMWRLDYEQQKEKKSQQAPRILKAKKRYKESHARRRRQDSD